VAPFAIAQNAYIGAITLDADFQSKKGFVVVENDWVHVTQGDD
jgi:hypothetical protein